MRAVRGVVRAAIRRRRLQSLVIAVVALLSTGTVVLAAGLLVVSDAPFDHAFGRQAGAHAAATFDAGRAGVDALRATTSRPGVTAAAGPFDATAVGLAAGPFRLGTLTVVGRADPGGPVDRLTVDSGQWLTGPGQIVLSRAAAGSKGTAAGDPVTVNVPGSPTLRVVGIADSVTGTAGAWVWPTESAVLHADGATPTRQMLYRFASAGDDAAVTASLSAATAGLPAGALLGSATYLTVKRQADAATAPVVPFVVAFAILGLAMSVLIVANVVNGAVVAGYRTIGVLKTLGFTPRQVVTVYTGQILVPGILGCLAGVLLGNLMALPLLAQTSRAYDVSSTGGVPGWVDLLAVLGMPAVIAVAAVVPAMRAGRFSAVQAISTGRAPRTGRGYRIRRALAATRLPLPARFGLGTPFARPALSAVTLVAVLLGATTVVFAAGLASSLNLVAAAITRTAQVPVDVHLAVSGIRKNGTTSTTTADAASVAAAIRAQPGTAHVAGVTDVDVTLVGFTRTVTLQAYDGDPTWVGFPLIAGRWYTGPGEAVAASALLRATGHRIGDTVTLAADKGQRQVRIVGEIFDEARGGVTLTAATAALTGLTEHTSPTRFEIGLTAGTSPDSYATALSTAVGDGASVRVRDESNTARTFAILLTLVGTLTLLLSTVAALGVLNTVVLNTRERVHEIGVLKTLGMTPRQVRTMVVSSMVGIGLLAAVLAAPLGYALHHRVLPVMADAAGTRIPASFVDVYRPLELTGLAAAGILLAVLGALIPAGWAAGTRIATALRAE
jgi:putative ABC transport system permease protein